MSTAAPAGNIVDKHGKWEYDEAVKSFEAIGAKLEDLMSIIKEVNVKIDEAERRRKKAMLQAKLFRLQRLRKASSKTEEEAVSEHDYGGKLSVSAPSAPAVPKREEDEAKREEDEIKSKLSKLEEEDEASKREEEGEEAGRKHLEELRTRLEEAKHNVEEARAKREASLKTAGVSPQGKGQQGEVKEEQKGTVIGAGQTPDYWPELKKAWARYEGIGLLSSG